LLCFGSIGARFGHSEAIALGRVASARTAWRWSRRAQRGIHYALEGRLGAAVELRRSPSGKDWARLSVGVGEGDEVTRVSVSVFEEKAVALAGLTKGAEVYVEGRLPLNTWTGGGWASRAPGSP
jgi:hypothetical protein